MNNLLKLFLIALVTFFSACQSKTVLNHFENSEDAAHALQFTKKTDILVNNEPKVLFFATYLNKVNENYEKEGIDSFVLSVHMVNEEDKNLKNSDFSLFLQDRADETEEEKAKRKELENSVTYKKVEKDIIVHKPLSIKLLDKNSKLFKDISLKNKWSNYYVVDFKAIDTFERKLNLKLSHPKFGQVNLSFQK